MKITSTRTGAATYTARVVRDDGVTLEVPGDVDPIEAALRPALQEGEANLVLDLRDVTFIDTAGVRLVLLANRWQQRAGHALTVILGEGLVQRVLEVSGLTMILNIQSG